MKQSVTITLPDWTAEFLQGKATHFPDPEERMRLAIELSRWNVERGTGGPFGAAVFEEESGRLVAVGVNRVVPLNCSTAHAEVLALSMAQAKLDQFDLGAPGLPAHELVTSSQPCAMCFGASIWSGIRRMVYGATANDVESLVGFDEGPLPSDWKQQMTARGIEVVGEMLRDEAREVLALYSQKQGVVYNGRQASIVDGDVRAEG